MEYTAVPYIVYESAQARAERNARRLTIALVIAVLLVFISNAAWLWAWMQYDYTSDTTTTETSISYTSGTDFGKAITGKDSAALWALMDDLMSTLQIAVPKLYDGVMRQLPA